MIADLPDETIRAAATGDTAAFAEVYRHYWKWVLYVCGRYLAEEAEDCAQDTMTNLFRFFHKFNFESKFSTWLTSIAINACKAALRRRESRIVTTPNIATNENGDVIDIFSNIATSPTQEAEAIHQEERRQLDKLISTLTPRKQKALRSFLLGKSLRDTAKETGMTVYNVKSTVYRAQEHLINKAKGANA